MGLILKDTEKGRAAQQWCSGGQKQRVSMVYFVATIYKHRARKAP